MREVVPDREPQTRLATVTGAPASETVLVRFDGESVASARSYARLTGPLDIGDRVVMLRAGSSWACLARVPTAAQAPDTGWIAPTLVGGWSNYGSGYVPARYRRLNGIVYAQGLVRFGSGTIFTLPVGFRPAFNMLTTGIEGTNTVCRTDFNANGTVVAAAGASNSLWSFNAVFPAEAA